jgi:hypothetical protein
MDINWITLVAVVYSMSVSCCSSFRDLKVCSHGIAMEKCGEKAAKFTDDIINQKIPPIIQVWTSAMTCNIHITFS